MVAQRSAVLPGYASIGIGSDHTNMTKFSSSDDPGFVVICNALGQSTKRMDIAKKQYEIPEMSRDNTSYCKQGFGYFLA